MKEYEMPDGASAEQRYSITEKCFKHSIPA